MRVAYAREVADDLAGARTWYESRAPGLGEDFLRMAYATISELGEFPYSNGTVYNSFRRALLRRFPYSVYYFVSHDVITVYGVFHSSKDPQVIRQLLDTR
ncbi:MAG: type II toxin-antitoxin system RelE/ParE family toxin [bacterium]